MGEKRCDEKRYWEKEEIKFRILARCSLVILFLERRFVFYFPFLAYQMDEWSEVGDI